MRGSRDKKGGIKGPTHARRTGARTRVRIRTEQKEKCTVGLAKCVVGGLSCVFHIRGGSPALLFFLAVVFFLAFVYGCRGFRVVSCFIVCRCLTQFCLSKFVNARCRVLRRSSWFHCLFDISALFTIHLLVQCVWTVTENSHQIRSTPAFVGFQTCRWIRHQLEWSFRHSHPKMRQPAH